MLAERHHIYAKLYSPGGSVILTASALVDAERFNEYSSEIGNSFHLDLIDLQTELSKLTPVEQATLKSWADGMTSQQAAVILGAKGPVTIRKRRERATQALTTGMNESGERANIRGTGDRPSEEGSPPNGDDSIPSRDIGQPPTTIDTEARVTDEQTREAQ